MKKLMILAVALFSMTTTFAADENASATTATAAFNMNIPFWLTFRKISHKITNICKVL